MIGEMRDLIAMLACDHHELQDMFDALARASDLSERRRIVQDIEVELAWYTSIEERFLYPAVRRHLADGDRIAAKGMSDNAEAGRILDDLRAATEADRWGEPLVRRLIDELDEHMRQEADVVFPGLTARADPEDLRRLGSQIQRLFDDASRCDVPIPPHALSSGWRPRVRPYTPRHPDANKQSSMWPDLWAAHRYW
jgi:iron-sulfur cluster repair protein YtfE (RIC family)